jgi:acyl-CoA oxidase
MALYLTIEQLLKTARSVLKGNAAANDTAAIFRTFLDKQDMGAAFDILGSDSDLVAAFAWRTSFLTFEALKHRDVEKSSWNSLLVDFWRLSTAHSQYLVVKNFYDALQSKSLYEELDEPTIELLRKLYALHTLEKEASEFYSSAAVTVRQLQLARTKTIMKLLEDIRPHALRLVDAWQFPDWQLDSSLGRKDGKVYEDLFHRASELNPLNGLTVDPYPENDNLIKRDDREKYRTKSKL